MTKTTCTFTNSGLKSSQTVFKQYIIYTSKLSSDYWVSEVIYVTLNSNDTSNIKTSLGMTYNILILNLFYNIAAHYIFKCYLQL